MMGINAVKGVEIGAGFARRRAARHRARRRADAARASSATTPAASSAASRPGQDIIVSIAIKPTSLDPRPRHSIDQAGRPVDRRDASAATTRASASARRRSPRRCWRCVLMDHALRHRAQNADVRWQRRALRPRRLPTSARDCAGRTRSTIPIPTKLRTTPRSHAVWLHPRRAAKLAAVKGRSGRGAPPFCTHVGRVPKFRDVRLLVRRFRRRDRGRRCPLAKVSANVLAGTQLPRIGDDGSIGAWRQSRSRARARTSGLSSASVAPRRSSLALRSRNAIATGAHERVDACASGAFAARALRNSRHRRARAAPSRRDVRPRSVDARMRGRAGSPRSRARAYCRARRAAG